MISPPGDLDPNTDMVTCADAARLMVAASAADVETRSGGAVEVWTIQSDGDLVHASGPRLLLWGGMQLWWRFLDHQGMPHRAELHIVESRYKSDARASLTSRSWRSPSTERHVCTTDAPSPDPCHSPRFTVSGSSTLTE